MNEQVTTDVRDLSVACTLPEDRRSERQEEIDHDISGGILERIELADGFEFRFAGDEEWLVRLMQFVKFERRCCRFLTFEIVSEPDEGPMRLRLRGPEGTKEFINTML
jgi:hypothetical protein